MTQPESFHEKNSDLKALTDKAANGDGEALYELCEKIAKDVLFRATYIMGNQSDAEDVTQEVLLRLCKNIKDLRNAKVFNAWLGKIIANEANRFMSEKARRGVVVNIDDYLGALMEEKGDFLPQEYAESEECRKAVVEIIEGLPMRQREAVLFHYYDGLSVTDTAEAMGVSWQCISEYLAVAREKIKRELEKRQLGMQNLGGIAALPLGALLTGTLQQSSEVFVPANQAWMQQALAGCREYIQANLAAAAASTTAATTATTATTASGALFGPLAGALATIVTTAAVVTGVAMGGDMSGSIESRVAFSGGIDYGSDIVYVNPARAEPETDGTGEEAEVINWWITKAGEETTLYSGEGPVVEDELILLRDTGEGEYMIFFRLKDEAGGAYTLSSNFYIMSESNEIDESG